MWKAPLLLIAMLILTQGCQNTTVQNDLGCAWIKPITTTDDERLALTRQTKIQIAAHNEMYDLRCAPKNNDYTTN